MEGRKLLVEVVAACEQLSLGRTKFYEEVHAGRLTLVKAGKKSLVPQQSLDAYVEMKIAEAKASGDHSSSVPGTRAAADADAPKRRGSQPGRKAIVKKSLVERARIKERAPVE